VSEREVYERGRAFGRALREMERAYGALGRGMAEGYRPKEPRSSVKKPHPPHVTFVVGFVGGLFVGALSVLAVLL
jgi:hypothetical protein